MNHCPCGHNIPYQQCCGQYIENEIDAPTPEALMRSRYTAYSLSKIDYVASTMKGNAALGFDKESAKRWSQSLTWLSLEVSSHKMKSPTVGFVIFEVKYLENGKTRIMREKSEFHKIDEKWYYVAGKSLNPHKGTPNDR
ncbi:MAG: YchJ family protein [Candidatus Berkiella sp.]